MTFLAIGLVACAAAFRAYRHRVSGAHPPELVFRPTALLAHLHASCPTLREPYRPPWWSANRHLQLALLAWHDGRTPPLGFDRTDTLTLPDGGTVSLDWLGLADAATTPTLVVLPTICGDGQSIRRTVLDLRHRLGWRIVVCNRRGHGTLPLTTPRFSTLGATDDVRAQLARIRANVPDAPLYGLGVSAGSGLLVRYLGEEGARTPLAAGIAYCPGYDTTRAFHRVSALYDGYLLRAVRRHFVERHAAARAFRPGHDAIMRSRTIGALHDNQYAFAGFASAADYHAATNPMLVADAIRVPILILNAADDPICTLANVDEHRGLFTRVPESLLVLTRRGSHCAFFEGHWRPRSWAHRLIGEYLAAVHNWRTAAKTPRSAALR